MFEANLLFSTALFCCFFPLYFQLPLLCSFRETVTLTAEEISRDLVADVCVASLTDAKASNKVLEIIEDEGRNPTAIFSVASERKRTEHNLLAKAMMIGSILKETKTTTKWEIDCARYIKIYAI